MAENDRQDDAFERGEERPASGYAADDDRDVRDALANAAYVPAVGEVYESVLRETVLARYDEVYAPRAVPAPSRTRRRLSMLTSLVALTLVICVALWPAGPAFSFETMRSAILKQSVMRLAGINEAGTGVVGWYRPGKTARGGGSLAAVESAGRVYWAAGAEHSLVGYDVTSGTIKPGEEPAAGRLLSVMSLVDGERIGRREEVFETVRVNGHEMGELAVRYGRHRVTFTVDLETSLPTSFHFDGQAPVKVEFREADQGPVSLAMLGVPSDALLTASKLVEIDNTLLAGGDGAGAGDDASSVSRPPQTAMRETVDGPQPQEVVDSPAAIAAVELAIVPETSLHDGNQAIERWQRSKAVTVPIDWAAMSKRIDGRFRQLWDEADVDPAGPSTWHELHRRLSIDLTGRTPTIDEIRTRQSLSSSELVDTFVNSPEFSEHLASVWTELLLPDGADLTPFGGQGEFEGWLAKEFASGVGYDEIVRRLLLAEGRVNESGPVLFYTALNMEPERLAKQVSRVFLGTQIDCAQCHDHPYDAWTQEDFWGFAAFFSRISRPQGNMEMLSTVLRVKDTSRGEVMFPETEDVVPPRFLGGDVLPEEPGNTKRREALADWLTSRENRQFARSTVNHLWAYLFGKGLVAPADDFGPHNPALDDVLLDELAESFASGGYDIKALVRTLVGTYVYQQSSQSYVDEPRRRKLFAQREPKWLAAGQLYDAAMAAARGVSAPVISSTSSLSLVGPAFSSNMLSRDAFIEQFSAPAGSPVEYQAGIPQALSLMNGLLTQSASSPETSQMLKALTAPFLSDRQRIETVFLATVGRPPEPQEIESLLPLLEGVAAPERQEVLSDIFWALLNSAEFATNH